MRIKRVYFTVGLFASVFVPGVSSASSCLQPPAKVADAEIQSFLSDPGILLDATKFGGLTLSSSVRGLAASESDTLPLILKLLDQASSEQSAAIGAGLARAVEACASIDAGYADRIQKAVAEYNNPGLLTAFAAALTEVQTAAIGGGGGPGGGGVGGGTTGSLGVSGGPNNYRGGKTTTADIAPFGFSSGTVNRQIASPSQ